MSDIPTARALLKQALEIDKTGPEMRELIGQALALMTRERRKPVRARAKLAAPTAEEEREIRQIVRRNPFISVLELARRFRTNPGRISEALEGQR